jgi:hypothetical protein
VGHTGARFGSPAQRRRLGGETTETAENEQRPEPPPSVPADTSGPPAGIQAGIQAEVGHIGARFGSSAMRRRMRAQAVSPEPPPPKPKPEPDSAEGRPIDDAGAPAPPTRELQRPPAEIFGDEAGTRAPDRVPSLVRPYAWTGGRTTSSCDLHLETLVSAHPAAALRTPASTPEYRRIVDLCAIPTSVAEIAAALSVPLGVVRVLLGDLIEMRIVTAHQNGATDGAPEMALLERVLAGLHQL